MRRFAIACSLLLLLGLPGCGDPEPEPLAKAEQAPYSPEPRGGTRDAPPLGEPAEKLNPREVDPKEGEDE